MASSIAVSIVALLAACEANKVLEVKGSFLDLAQFECDSCVEQQQQEGNPLIGKDVFVIDNNFGHVLGGFVGDAMPSIDAQLEYDGGYLHESPVWESVKEEWANLFPADIRGRDVLMTIHPKTSDKNKENIGDIMFGTFGVANLFLMYRQELAIETGTIIDINTKHHELSVVPVYDGFAIEDGLEFSPQTLDLVHLKIMIHESMETVDANVRKDVTAKYLVMTDMESVPDCVCIHGMDQPMKVYNDEHFVWSQATNLCSDEAFAMPWVSMIDYQICGGSAVHTFCHVDPRHLMIANRSSALSSASIANRSVWSSASIANRSVWSSASIANRSVLHLFDFPQEAGTESGGEYVLMITMTKPMMFVFAVVVLLLTVLIAFNVYHWCVANDGYVKIADTDSEMEMINA